MFLNTWTLRELEHATRTLKQLLRTRRPRKADDNSEKKSGNSGKGHGRYRYAAPLPDYSVSGASDASADVSDYEWTPVSSTILHDIPWMKMTMQTPYLRIPKHAKGANCSDHGVVFRAPYRLYTDQRIFRDKRGRRSGSVLIDTSGSMCLSAEQIMAIVKKAPAAVIGLYGGYDPEVGAVRVIAKMGRLVVDDKEYAAVGEYNGVDGPALQWLGIQPLPRLWVSDGLVTGIEDETSDGLCIEAELICRRYRIRRVHTLDEVQRYI